MTILLAILLVLALAYSITRTAWRYHVAQLRLEREKRNANYAAAKILADNLETVAFGRDYFRSALVEITRVASESEPAGQIARRFLALDDRDAA